MRWILRTGMIVTAVSMVLTSIRFFQSTVSPLRERLEPPDAGEPTLFSIPATPMPENCTPAVDPKNVWWERDDSVKLRSFPRIYYITMSAEGVRASRLIQYIRKNKLLSEKVDATNATEAANLACIIRAAVEIHGWPAIGLTVSHLRAMEQFLASGEPTGVIVEDDVSFEFVHFWCATWSQYEALAPRDYPFLQLAVSAYTDNLIRPWANKTVDFWGACAYVVTREWAKTLLSYTHWAVRWDLTSWRRNPVADIVVYGHREPKTCCTGLPLPSGYSAMLLSHRNDTPSQVQVTKKSFISRVFENQRQWFAVTPS